MAGKISEMNTIASSAGADAFEISRSGATYRATLDQLKTYIHAQLEAGTLTLASLLTANGGLTMGGAVKLKTTSTVTAAGTTQGTATAVDADIVRVSTATANQGIVLPAATVGRRITIINATTALIKVYPASGESFAGQATFAANLSASLLAGGTATISCGVAGVWSAPYLWQGSTGANNFSIGGIIQTGSGSTNAITTIMAPNGGAQMSVSDSIVVIGGVGAYLQGSFLIYQGGGLKFLQSSTLDGQIITSNTPDMSLNVAPSAGAAVLNVVRLTAVASSVNNVKITNGATGNPVDIAAEGSNTDINIRLSGKGAGMVDLASIPRIPTYTVGTLPTASSFTRGLINVSDGTVNKRLAISDGTNWRFPDGNIVS